MRHMRIAMTLLAVALAFGSGCNKKNKDAGAGSGSAAATGSAGSGSATASGSGSAAGSGSGSDSAELQMAKAAGNCPSTVAGTTSKAEVSGKDLVLTITSDDKDSVAAIQKRTEEMIAVKTGAGAGSGTGHDARGSHGGKVGLCPAHVPEGATIKSATIANGVTITITPKDGVDALKTEVDARITKAADWVKANVKAGDKMTKGGVGGGSGNDGMNHSGQGDGKGAERKAAGTGSGDGKGGGKGTGGGGGAGTGGGGSGSGSAKK